MEASAVREKTPESAESGRLRRRLGSHATMTSPVERILLKFTRRLRSGRHGLAILVLLGLVLLAEGLLVVHRIDHAGASDSAACVLCSAADQQTAASAAPLPPKADVSPAAVTTVVGIPAGLPTTLAYRSRAPPHRPRS